MSVGGLLPHVWQSCGILHQERLDTCQVVKRGSSFRGQCNPASSALRVVGSVPRRVVVCGVPGAVFNRGFGGRRKMGGDCRDLSGM